MMSELLKISHDTTIKIIECGTCGIAFGLPETLYDACYKEGGFWCCPLGHRRGWAEGQKERDKKDLKRKLEEKDAQLRNAQKLREWAKREAEVQKRSAAAYKGKLKSAKRRAAAGCCPCCGRTFKQLAAHMANKHPEYLNDQNIKPWRVTQENE